MSSSHKDDKPAAAPRWREMLENFSQYTTMHGVRYLCGTHVIRRIIWILVCMTASAVFGYLIYTKVAYLLTNPKTVNIDVTYTDRLRFPAVTLCNENNVRTTSLQEMGLYDVIMEHTEKRRTRGNVFPACTDGYDYNDNVCGLPNHHDGPMEMLTQFNETTRVVCKEICSRVHSDSCSSIFYNRETRSCTVMTFLADETKHVTCEDPDVEYYRRRPCIEFDEIHWDFESEDMPGFSNVSSIDTWKRIQAGSPDAESTSTIRGDNTIGTGHYMYLRNVQSEARKEAAFISPLLNTTDKCIQIMYWINEDFLMYPEIEIYTRTEDLVERILAILSSRLSGWDTQFVELPPGISRVGIRSRSELKSRQSLAVDDITIMNCQLFQERMCVMTKRGLDFLGSINESDKGEHCSRWSAYPYFPTNYMKYHVVGNNDNNYCRNFPLMRRHVPSCVVENFMGDTALHPCYIPYCNCTESQFQCSDGLCVPKAVLCDGKNDCQDGVDEFKACAEKRNMGCSFEEPYLCGYANVLASPVPFTRIHGPGYNKQSPKTDSKKSINSYYLLMDSRYGSAGSTSLLLSPVLYVHPNSSLTFSSFQSALREDQTADLQVTLTTGAGFPINSTATIQPGDAPGWTSHKHCLPSGKFAIGFLAIRGRQYESDIAIDEVGVHVDFTGECALSVLDTTDYSQNCTDWIDMCGYSTIGTSSLFSWKRSLAELATHKTQPVTTTACPQNFTAQTGDVYSSYLPKYGNNVHCEYRLEAPPGKRVYVEFLSFQLEPQEQCSYDYVEIQDIGGVNVQPKRRFCGTMPPDPQFSTGNVLVVIFHTDSSDVDLGFHFTYAYTDAEYVILARPENSLDGTVEFASFGTRDLYFPDTFCLSLVAIVPSNMFITMQYISSDNHQMQRIPVFQESLGLAEEKWATLRLEVQPPESIPYNLIFETMSNGSNIYTTAVKELHIECGLCNDLHAGTNDTLCEMDIMRAEFGDCLELTCNLASLNGCGFTDVSRGLFRWTNAEYFIRVNFEHEFPDTGSRLPFDGISYSPAYQRSPLLTVTADMCLVVTVMVDNPSLQLGFSFILKEEKEVNGTYGERDYVIVNNRETGYYRVPRGEMYLVFRAESIDGLPAGSVRIVSLGLLKSLGYEDCEPLPEEDDERTEDRVYFADDPRQNWNSSETPLLDSFECSDFKGNMCAIFKITSDDSVIWEIVPKTGLVCATDADIVFVVDSSGSIDGANWGVVLAFLENIVLNGRFRIDPLATRVGIVTYGSSVRIKMFLNETVSIENTIQTIRNILRDGGTTDMTSALQITREQVFNTNSGDRPESPNIMILMTDGVPNEPPLAGRQAKITKAAGISIITVGIGDLIDSDFLIEVATQPSNYIFVSDFQELGEILDPLLDTVCNDLFVTAHDEVNSEEEYGLVFNQPVGMSSSADSAGYLIMPPMFVDDVMCLSLRWLAITEVQISLHTSEKIYVVLEDTPILETIKAVHFDVKNIVGGEPFFITITVKTRDGNEQEPTSAVRARFDYIGAIPSRCKFTVSSKNVTCDFSTDCGYVDQSEGKRRWNVHEDPQTKDFFMAVSPEQDTISVLESPTVEIDGHSCLQFSYRLESSNVQLTVDVINDGEFQTTLDTQPVYYKWVVSSHTLTGRGVYGFLFNAALRTDSDLNNRVYIDDVLISRKGPCPETVEITPKSCVSSSGTHAWFDLQNCCQAMYGNKHLHKIPDSYFNWIQFDLPGDYLVSRMDIYVACDIDLQCSKYELTVSNGAHTQLDSACVGSDSRAPDCMNPPVSYNLGELSHTAITFVRLSCLETCRQSDSQLFRFSMQEITFHGTQLKGRRPSIHRIIRQPNLYHLLGKNAEMEVTELKRRLSHNIEDFIVDCKWEGRDCDPDHVRQIQTDQGYCVSFNYNESDILATTKTGSTDGLHLVLNIEGYDDVTLGDMNGARIGLHNQDDIPYVQQLGFGIAPGFHSLVAASYETVKSLGDPWGNCTDRELRYYMDQTYSQRKCRVQFSTQETEKRCGCKDSWMPGPSIYCNVIDYLVCLRPIGGNVVEESVNETCPDACSVVNFDTSLSFSELTLRSVAEFINKPESNITHRFLESLEMRSRVDSLAVTNTLHLVRNVYKHREEMESYIRVNMIEDNTSIQTYIYKSVNDLRLLAKQDIKEGLFQDLENIIDTYKADFLPNLKSVIANLDSVSNVLTEFKMGCFRLSFQLQQGSNDTRLDALENIGHTAVRKLDGVSYVVSSWQAGRLSASVEEDKKVANCSKHQRGIVEYMNDVAMPTTLRALAVINQINDSFVSTGNTTNSNADVADIQSTCTDLDHIANSIIRQSEQVGECLTEYGTFLTEMELWLEALELGDIMSDPYQLADVLGGLENDRTTLRDHVGQYAMNKISKKDLAELIMGDFKDTFHLATERVSSSVDKLAVSPLFDIVNKNNGIVFDAYMKGLTYYEKLSKFLGSSNATKTARGLSIWKKPIPTTLDQIQFELNGATDLNSVWADTYDLQTFMREAAKGQLSNIVDDYTRDLQSSLGEVSTSIQEMARQSSASFAALTEELTAYNDSLRMGGSFIWHNFLVVDIFYGELKYEKIEQQPAYDLPTFFSDVGGYMGLLLGGSAITVCELIDLIVYYLAMKCAQKRQHEPDSI